MQATRVRCVQVLALAAALSLIPSSLGAAEEAPRFVSKGRVSGEGSADWVTRDRDRMAFGSGSRFSIVDADSGRSVFSADVGTLLSAGWLAGSDLYLATTTNDGDELSRIDLDLPGSEPELFGLKSATPGTMRLVQMDDHLLVSTSGVGVHVLRLAAEHHSADGTVHRMGEDLAPVGLLPLDEPILTLTTSLRTIWIATERELIRVDANAPEAPFIAGRWPVDERIHSLAANADTVYVLSDAGLRTLDLDTGLGLRTTSHAPDVRGRGLLTLGRSVYVAAGNSGVLRFQDRSPEEALFMVQVGDIFFNPAGVLNLNVGDSVQWQKPGTAFSHNVRACTVGQTGCAVNATEFFTSGGVTAAPFNYSFTFNTPGNNPYLCQNHVFSMVGNIVVSGGPVAPPAVPDGDGILSPMTVGKTVPGGADLEIQFDTGCPDAVNHDLLFGTSASLPATPGDTFGLAGSSCATGGSPFTWLGSPAPPSGTFVWWVLVADDGVSTEGSWGLDSSGAQRSGGGLNGSSGLCGNTDKDTSNACGQ